MCTEVRQCGEKVTWRSTARRLVKACIVPIRESVPFAAFPFEEPKLSKLCLLERKLSRTEICCPSRDDRNPSNCSVKLPALKKSFNSVKNILNCSTNASLNWPGVLVMRFSIASVAIKSSGPAFLCSLFWIVCLISCFTS